MKKNREIKTRRWEIRKEGMQKERKNKIGRFEVFTPISKI
jgi:hypothetical protein